MDRDHGQSLTSSHQVPRHFGDGTRIPEELAARWFQALYETPLLFSGILDARGRVLEANRLSIEGCGLVRAEIIGRPFWEGGWWSPDPQVSRHIQQWCEQALATGEPVRKVTRYFFGRDTPRMVDLALFPVRDDGMADYLVATGADVTDALAASHERAERMRIEAEALRRMAVDREGELRIVRDAGRQSDERLNRLVSVAMELAGVESVAELTRIIVDAALPMFGADGGAVAVRDEADQLRLSVSDRLGRQMHRTDLTVPLSAQIPAAYSARTGNRLLLPTMASGLAFSTDMADVYAATRRSAWASLPLRAGPRLLGALVVSWRNERNLDNDEVRMLEGFAAQCASTLDRIDHLQAQRESAHAAQRLSESLQRSLLTQPTTPDSVDIAVRYQPAVHEAEVGGDWYDSFITAAGTTVLAVGDVIGHDRVAAATMGQIRSMARALAFDGRDGPARLLGRLDRALLGLEIDTLATAILARVEVDPAGDPAGRNVLRWSNAGHPPPLLRHPDGAVRMLDGTRDPLLGLKPDTSRVERVVDLPDGCTLLLYTDGLVEQRDVGLGEGIADLVRRFGLVGDQEPDQVCDSLLDAVPVDHEDDIALLVLRVAKRA